MKTKIFSLCLMAALCFPFMAYCQYYDDVDIDEIIEKAWDPQQKAIDSLKQLSMNYYKDLSHWDIFIEPAVTVQEDTAFDPAGMKHAYFVRRFYFIAVPHASDFQYQPSVVGPHLYAYGQKMPLEAHDAQQLQMIRKAVFPFAADFSANTSSRAIFQQYVEKNFDKDYQYVVDSLIAWKISHLKSYDFRDTTSSSDVISVEISQKIKRSNILTCLTDEYAKAVPQPTITEAPAREPIESPKSIEQLKNMTVKKQNNIYLLPANSILNGIAQQPSENYYDEEEAYESTIAGMAIHRDDYEEYEYSPNYTDFPVSVSGQSYFMLNSHAVLLFPEVYYGGDPYETEFAFFLESRNRYDRKQTPDTVLIIYPDRIKKMTLKECYEAGLKDTSCSIHSQFPPYLTVYVSDDLYEEGYYDDCKECYTKSAILGHLNEGSVLYDYFAKDFYKNNLAYTSSKSIGYAPNYYRYLDDYDYDYEYDDVESEGADTVYFSKEQSQRIRKLMKKRIHLYGQVMKLKTKAYAVAAPSEIPQGQIHITHSRWGWEIEGENTQKEESYDEDLVVVAVDDVEDVVNGTNDYQKKKEPWEKRFDKMEKKFYQLIDKIEEVEAAINTITGHSIEFEY